MSTLIKHAGSSHNIDSVLDMGSGQGYLSRALAFHHDMRVLAVDMSEVQTKGAEKFDRRALYKDNKERKDKLTHITEKITPENVSGVLARWSDSPDNQKWLICGLHACGDLSTMIMRLFAESDQVTGLVNVGCCYHYLSEGKEASGFPMSDTLASMNFTMGTTARVLACHSPWHWPNEKEASRKSFQQHFFRALLQKIMVDKNLASASSPHVLAHRINKKNNFDGYVRAALKKFGLAPDAISADEAERYLQEYQQAEKQVTILWTLRSLMANVLESIVLVDRWLYLNQVVKGHSPDAGVWLWPLFDPMESPRNMVFVASK
ncbi:methyltransferase domain-containing protein [Fennellomyces sp. T-0311]|nr:methyltransferase domain-containing protein [Fennellomyces sp. T-0311]